MCTDYPKQVLNAIVLHFDRGVCSVSICVNKMTVSNTLDRCHTKEGRSVFMQRFEMQDTHNANEIHHVTSDRPVHSFIYIASTLWPSEVGLWWSVCFYFFSKFRSKPSVYCACRVMPLRPHFVSFDQMLNYGVRSNEEPLVWFWSTTRECGKKKASTLQQPPNYLKWS